MGITTFGQNKHGNQFIYIFQATQKSVDENIICVEILELNGCVSQHVL